MRVTTAFNRLLGIAGVSVAAVRFERDLVLVGLRVQRRLVCPRCGCVGRAGYDRRLRRWRHSNSRLEALNAPIRLINHRSCGFHSPKPLIALIHLCCGQITIPLPT
jgi:hypothetical protein